jgi:methionyl-tRNA synthetase
MTKLFYISTAIDYVNGQPHIGHAYEKIIADVIARSHNERFFLTGVDEHGQKVQQAALKVETEPQKYCDALAEEWKCFADALNISYDDFVRTSSEFHKTFVSDVLTFLYEKGDIYKKEYVGWYSQKEETFLTEKDKLSDGTFPPQYGVVAELREENYYFRLSKYQSWLKEFISIHTDWIHPQTKINEVVKLLESDLEDLCITRPRERLKWGIPLPFDDNFVVYVWFDALLNYLSIPAKYGDPVVSSVFKKYAQDNGKRLWPCDVHVVGKDILKFHAVIWPIILKSIFQYTALRDDEFLPKTLVVHGWWQKDGKKISKSDGNTIDPVAIINKYGTDALRYYLCRELSIGGDGNWTETSFNARFSDLNNILGNLVQRICTLVKKNRSHGITTKTATGKFVFPKLEGLDFHQHLAKIFEVLSEINAYIQKTQPFSLIKLGENEKFDAICADVLRGVLDAAYIIDIYLPTTSACIKTFITRTSQQNIDTFIINDFHILFSKK